MLTFPAGLPGFDGQTLFTVVEKPELAPIVFLQSLNSPELCFLAAPVGAVEPQLCLGADSRGSRTSRLWIPRANPYPTSTVLSLALVCAPENGPLTANLLAPVVINLHTRIAVQAVRRGRALFSPAPYCLTEAERMLVIRRRPRRNAGDRREIRDRNSGRQRLAGQAGHPRAQVRDGAAQGNPAHARPEPRLGARSFSAAVERASARSLKKPLALADKPYVIRKPGKDSPADQNSRREYRGFYINTNIASLQAQNYLQPNASLPEPDHQ